MKAPSREWREILAPDEEQRFSHYAEQLAQIQKKKNAEFGQGRALHRKQLIGLEAELEIIENLPGHARYGLFAQAGTHRALVRLSNGGLNVQDDRVPDIRGFAFKVLGIEGPGALGTVTKAQDFLLINREVFGLKDSDAFMKLVLASAQGGGALIKHFIRKHGLIQGLRQLIAIGKSIKRPFSGYATEPFFSAAPLACGPYAVRVRLLPPEGQTINHQASEDWAQDIRQRLALGPLRYTLQLQFFVAETLTPIEDTSVNWDEKAAPYVTVGYLKLLPPAASSFEALQKRTDEEAFDPWCALADHRPLGDVMRARKHAYFASQKNRKTR
jgi:catalase